MKYALTTAQKRIWIECKKDFTSTSYIESILLKLNGSICGEVFASSWDKLLKTHEAFRISFREDKEGNPFQIINNNYNNNFEVINLSYIYFLEREKAAYAIIEQKRQNKMDLCQAPLCCGWLIQLTDTEFYLLMSFHHLVVDGISIDFFIDDLFKIYSNRESSFLKNSQEQFAKNELSIVNYLDFENKWLAETQKLAAEFWGKILDEAKLRISFPALPSDITSNVAKREFFDLSVEITQEIKKCAHIQKTTLFTILTVVFFISLYRICNQDDLTICYASGSRPWQFKKFIGCLINVLPLRIKVFGESCFSEIIKSINSQRSAASKYVYYPFEEILNLLKEKGKAEVNRVFDVMIANANFGKRKFWLKGVTITSVPIDVRDAKNDFTLLYDDGGEFLRIAIEYKKKIFEECFIKQFVNIFKNILNSVIKDPNTSISLLQYLDYTELNLINTVNNTDCCYPLEPLSNMFIKQAQKMPENIAVIDSSGEYSYALIRQWVKQLAVKLYLFGVKRNQLVGVLCEKGYQQVVAVLGILEAGAAYLPLHVEWPESRLATVLEEGQARTLVISEKQYKRLANSSLLKKYQYVVLEWVLAEKEELLDDKKLPLIDLDDIAYVIFTSGSTGKPKGVMVSHRGAANTIWAVNQVYQVQATDKVLALSDLSFDLSVYDIFGLLAVGGTIVYPAADQTREPVHWLQLINQHRVTLWNTVPQLMKLLVEYVEEVKGVVDSIRVALLSGDWIPLTLPTKCKQLNPKMTVVSLGGATEGSIWSIWYEIREVASIWNSIPYGWPMPNQRMYILNEQQQLISLGIIGEIYIGGVGVALGYWGDPEKSAKQFIEHPKLGRLYKTGDLGRWNAEGYIEFHGRQDDQVKIHGYRVELGEITSELLKIPGIQEAYVTVKQLRDKQEPQLIAYYVLASGAVEPVDGYEAYLHDCLPTYMLPQSFIRLQAIPLTANGKVDQQALPEPEFIEVTKDYIAPRSEKEQILVRLWQDILHVDQVGIRDDFFRLGGDSILAIQLNFKMKKAGVPGSVRDIFERRTIERIADLPEREGLTAIIAEAGILTGEFNLSPLQRWFFTRNFSVPEHWNQSFLVRVPPLDKERLQGILPLLAMHHDVLRLSFNDGKQCYNNLTWFPELKVINCQNLSSKELEIILTSWQQDFNLYKGCLWSVGYIEGYSDKSARIFFAAHHLLIDTVSWRILMEDMQALYNNQTLAAKSSSYRQWLEKIDEYKKSHLQEASYWQAISQELSVKEIAVESKVEFKELRQQTISFTQELSAELLQQAGRAYFTEVNDLLLTALVYALYEVLGDKEQYVTLEGHGREIIDESLDLSRTVGWFTAMYPVKLVARETVASTIKYTKETLRQVPNKGIGYGIFTDYQYLPRISFNYLGQFSQQEVKWGLVAENAGVSIPAVALKDWDIMCNGQVIAGRLSFTLLSWLGKELHEKLVASYHHWLSRIIKHCCQQTKSTYTPSDFVGVKLSMELLEYLQKRYAIENVFMANSLQQGFIYHMLAAPQDDAYMVQSFFTYNRVIVPELYYRAWEYAVNKYPALRLCFNWEEEPLQIICSDVKLNYEYIDISAESDQEGCLDKIQKSDRSIKFDLAEPQLLRLKLIKQDTNIYTVLISAHHAILDGWSTNLNLLNYVHNCYLKLIRQESIEVIKEDVYIEAQKYFIKRMPEIENYWRSKMDLVKTINNLNRMLSCSINLDQPLVINEIREQELIIAGAEYRQIKIFAKDIGITINACLQFAWHKLIKDYTNDKQTIVGTTVSGRGIKVVRVEDSVGLYINTLPIILSWSSGSSVREQLFAIHSAISELNDYSFMSLSKLQKEGKRLFHSLFVFENYPTNVTTNNQLAMSFGKNIEKIDYPLCIVAFERQDAIYLRLKYAADYLTTMGAQRLLRQSAVLLKKIPESVDKDCQILSLIDKDEYQNIVYNWNKTTTPYPKRKNIPQLFARQVSLLPSNVALVWGKQQITYIELHKKSNQLARYLRQRYENLTLQPMPASTLIPICVERGISMVIGILGILKAGGGYVPIDSRYPQERIDFILEDCSARMIVIDKNVQKILAKTEIVSIVLDDESYISESANDLSVYASTEDIAYVIYTSGTTGQPKGVMQTHYNVLRLFDTCQKYFTFTANDVWTMFHSYVFDFSVWEIWGALLYGAKLIIPSYELTRDLNAFYELLKTQKVTVLNQTPSAFYQLIAVDSESDSRLGDLRYVIFGGEMLNPLLLRDWIEKYGFGNHSLVNMYGITETTVHVTYKLLTADDMQTTRANIGKKLDDLTAYILDEHLVLVPCGIPGELYIGGAGLAKGYLNRANLTLERFIPNPFATLEDKHKGYTRLYKTGDLARWLDNGEMEYLGRNDDQVKIRGFRIELGEIEAILGKYIAIKQCKVLAQERNDTRYLVAYYVAETVINREALYQHVSSFLPEYMVPSLYIHLNALPLNINGKVDRYALPKAEFEEVNTIVEPTNELQHKLVFIWQHILEVPNVGIQDDFFMLGGDSITSIKLANKIEKELHYRINIRDIFTNRTIEKLSLFLQTQKPKRGKRLRSYNFITNEE